VQTGGFSDLDYINQLNHQFSSDWRRQICT